MIKLDKSYYTFYLLSIGIAFFIGLCLILYSLACENVDDNKIFLSIGTSLVASSLILFLEYLNRKNSDKEKEIIKNVIYDAGIYEVHDNRIVDEYKILMKSAKKRIFVTGYSLNSFYGNHSRVLNDENKIKNLDVRFIVVKPDTNFSHNREGIENRERGHFKNNIERILKANSKKLWKIKYLDSPLTTMIFCIDDTMFVGPHLYCQDSQSTLTLKLKKNGFLFEEYLKEFESLWDASEDASID